MPKRALAFAICAVVYFWWTPPAATAANCGLPSGMQALMLELYSFTDGEQMLDARARYRVRALVDHLRQSGADEAFRQTAGSDIAESFDTVIAAAGNLGSGRLPEDIARLSSALDVIWNAPKTPCDEDQNMAGSSGAETGGLGEAAGLTSRPTERGDDPKALRLDKLTSPGKVEPDAVVTGSYRWLAFVLGGFSSILLMLYAGVASYGWLFAFVNGRKSCLIRAELELGLDVVDGHITILGRRGCRFTPVNEGAFIRIVQLVDEMPAEISVLVGGVVHEGGLHELKDGNCAVFWDDLMPRAQRAMLLAKSIIPPRLSKRTRQDARVIGSGNMVTPNKIEMPVVETEFDAPDLTNLSTAPLRQSKPE